jgi:hypothetical protein
MVVDGQKVVSMASNEKRRLRREQERAAAAAREADQAAANTASDSIPTEPETPASFFRHSIRWLRQGHTKTDKFGLYIGTVFVGGVLVPLAWVFLTPLLSKSPEPLVVQMPASAPPIQTAVGRLRPAKRGSAVPNGPIAFFMGGSEFVFHPTNGLAVPIIINGKPAVWVEYDSQRGAALSGDFYREDGRLVAQLRANNFRINENNYFKLKPRFDNYGLTVLDENEEVVLHVEFISENVFLIEGRLYSPNYGYVAIKRNEIKVQRGGLPDTYINMRFTNHPLTL